MFTKNSTLTTLAETGSHNDNTLLIAVCVVCVGLLLIAIGVCFVCFVRSRNTIHFSLTKPGTLRQGSRSRPTLKVTTGELTSPTAQKRPHSIRRGSSNLNANNAMAVFMLHQNSNPDSAEPPLLQPPVATQPFVRVAPQHKTSLDSNPPRHTQPEEGTTPPPPPPPPASPKFDEPSGAESGSSPIPLSFVTVASPPIPNIVVAVGSPQMLTKSLTPTLSSPQPPYRSLFHTLSTANNTSCASIHSSDSSQPISLGHKPVWWSSSIQRRESDPFSTRMPSSARQYSSPKGQRRGSSGSPARELASPSLDLALLLQCGAHTESFRVFLAEVVSCENLLFWQAADEVVTNPSIKLFNNIYDDFIADTGDGMINISSAVKDDLTKQITVMNSTNQIPEALVAAMRKAQAEIFELMDKDLLPKFLASEHSADWRALWEPKKRKMSISLFTG